MTVDKKPHGEDAENEKPQDEQDGGWRKLKIRNQDIRRNAPSRILIVPQKNNAKQMGGSLSSCLAGRQAMVHAKIDLREWRVGRGE